MQYARLLLGTVISLVLLIRAVEAQVLEVAPEQAQLGSVVAALTLYAPTARFRAARWGLLVPRGSA